MKDSRITGPELLLTFLSIAALLTVAFSARHSQAQTAAGKQGKGSDVLALAAELGSDNDNVRENAAESIRKVRNELVDRLIGFAKQPGKAMFAPNGEARGYLWHEPKHLAMLLLGDLRISEAVPLLLENIEYENPRERFTGMLDKDGRFPAVEALSKIGMPAVEPVVFKISKVDPKSKTADLCCWILNKILGGTLARTYIQMEIDRAQYSPEKERLKAALSYFKTDEEKAAEERAGQK